MGKIDTDEMYRVFNMGLGMVIICGAEKSDELTRAVPEAIRVGEVVGAEGKPRVVFE